jgi:hypothetical protein
MTVPTPLTHAQLLVAPAPLDALVRHFTDLRAGTHAGHADQADEESAFRAAVGPLDSPARARQLLTEFDTPSLLAPAP